MHESPLWFMKWWHYETSFLKLWMLYSQFCYKTSCFNCMCIDNFFWNCNAICWFSWTRVSISISISAYVMCFVCFTQNISLQSVYTNVFTLCSECLKPHHVLSFSVAGGPKVFFCIPIPCSSTYLTTVKFIACIYQCPCFTCYIPLVKISYGLLSDKHSDIKCTLNTQYTLKLDFNSFSQ